MDDRNQVPRRHVFAINTSPEFLNVVRELFQEEGYHVTTTDFVPTSFEQIETAHPDVLIVDVAVGQQAGWELLERLHGGAAIFGIPTLVVSTDRRLLTWAQDQAAQYGTHRYLEKPFDVDALLTTIQEMIGQA
jgi:CheY-like chemotaxis protein